MAKKVEAGSEEAFQSMDYCYMVENSSKCLSDRSPVCAAEEWKR